MRNGVNEERRQDREIAHCTPVFACKASALPSTGPLLKAGCGPSLAHRFLPQKQADASWWQPCSVAEYAPEFPEAALRTEEIRCPDLFQHIQSLGPYFAETERTALLCLPPFSAALERDAARRSTGMRAKATACA